MARPRTPTALKKVQATYRADRENPNEPQPPEGSVEPPSWLSRRAKYQWRKVAPALEAMGVLAVTDQMAFALLIDTYVEFRELREVIQEAGATYETPTPSGGTMRRPKPEIAMAADAWRPFISLSLSLDFGLTPATRSRISVVPPASEEDDAFVKYMAERRES